MDLNSKKRVLDEMSNLDSSPMMVAELDPDKVKSFQAGFGGQPNPQPAPPPATPEDSEKQKRFYQSLKQSLRG